MVLISLFASTNIIRGSIKWCYLKSKKAKKYSLQNNKYNSIKGNCIFVTLMGKNEPQSPWFLDLDVSNEFQTFLNKQDYFSLGRVILT